MRCPFCGSSLEKDAKYCNDCGTAVDSECKGKNLNYRSYIDTRPQVTGAPKTPSYRVRENGASDRPAQKPARPAFTEKKNPFEGSVQNIPTVPNPTPGQFGQYKGNTAKPAKKSGCAIVFVIIFVAFVIWGIIGAILEDVDFDSVFSTEPTSEYEYNQDVYDGPYADENGFANKAISGRTDGNYYLNDFVNFSFAIPEGFKEQLAFTVDSGISIIPDYRFENDKGEYILVGFAEEYDAGFFLADYVDEVCESMTDSGYNPEPSDVGEKQVYNNGFFNQRVSGSDGRTVDVYACPVDDMVFFVEINTSSAETNDSVVNSFVNSYASF